MSDTFTDHRRLFSIARLTVATHGKWRSLIDTLTDPYRPELHYMRGPGPKWRAKHAVRAGPETPGR